MSFFTAKVGNVVILMMATGMPKEGSFTHVVVHFFCLVLWFSRMLCALFLFSFMVFTHAVCIVSLRFYGFSYLLSPDHGARSTAAVNVKGEMNIKGTQ